MFVDSRQPQAGREPGATFQALCALADAQAAIAAARGDTGKALDIVVEAALAVAPDADGAAIELVEGDRLVYRAASGVARSHLGLSLGAASLSGLCVAQARPLIADDCDSDPRVDRAACRRIGVVSMVVTPVFRRGQAIGVLKLMSARRAAFTSTDVVIARLLVGALDAGFADAAESEADRALAASFAELEALYAGAPIGLALLDRDLVYRRCNARLAEINGLPAAAHVGRSVREALPRLADLLEPLLQQVLRSGVALRDFEIVGETAAAPGAERYWLVNFDPVFDPAGTVAGVNAAVVETTEWRRTEQIALRQARMLEEAIEPVLAWRPGGGIMFWNRAAAALYGYSEKEALGRSSHDLLATEAVGGDIAGIEAALERDGAWTGELRHRSKSGSALTVESRMSTLVERGQLVVVEGNRDITERAREKATLAASEAQFRTAAEALPGLLFVTAPDGRNVYVNEGYRALTGRSDEELLGDRWTEALHPDDSARAKAIWDEAVRSGSSYEVEYRFRRHDGAWRWHVARALPVRRGDGRVEQWVGCCVDIHERRIGEEELHRRVAEALAERRLWAEIVEASDAFIQVLDPELRILAINRANAAEIERIYGVRPRPGMRYAEMVPDDRALEELTALWRRALAGESYTHIGEYGDASRARRWYEMKFSPLYNSDGGLIGALRISYDVTERLGEQRALVARTEELRRANARLTAEIKRREETQAALAQAQKLEALGQLTSGIAHDFNNVTQAVAGGYALIRQRAADPGIVEIARHGAAAAERGGQLVKQMLAFARRQTLKPQRVELDRLLAEAAPLIQRTLGPGVALKVDCAPATPAVLADPALLETALINLAANARDAMPDGGSLVIQARESLAGEPHRPPELERRPAVAVAVSDTGRGISPAALQRVLEPFFTTKEQGRGAGLGLAMVHGFVRQSDGALRIESHEGRGTTVCLYLPRAEAAEEAPQEPTPRPPAATVTAPMTVLLIDDDEAVRGVIAGQLESLGHRVIPAADAKHVAAPDLDAVDLVISDLVRPGAEGLAAAQGLRRRRPNLPVLFVTGYADRSRLFDESVLEKPFASAALAEAIARAMSAAGEPGAGAEPALDRLAGRIKSGALSDLLRQWRAAQRDGALPRFDAFDPTTNGEPDKLIVVEVDAAHMPLRFHMTKVGSDLETALGRAMTGTDLAVTGDNDLGGLEAAYRRCVRTARPVYDYARLRLDEGTPDTFERLLTPWSTDGQAIDRLVGIAVFDGPGFAGATSKGTAP